ncbi:ergothioneine biosynthesis protein EgtB [Ketobacter sp.]
MAEASQQTDIRREFQRIRSCTEQITEGLSAEDMVVQSMPDASPTKWHLAHTSWFFEEFLLSRFIPQYQAFDSQFRFLFNSYYEAVGQRHQRPLRGMLTRPALDTVLAYRNHVTGHLTQALETGLAEDPQFLALVELGCHHEMQHQELLLTDILSVLSVHPFHPAMKVNAQKHLAGVNQIVSTGSASRWQHFEAQTIHVGADPDHFHYDCESPRHPHLLPAFALATHPVTNGQWLEFMADGGYDKATLWLSDGWAMCQQQQWHAPLYWQCIDGLWFQFGLDGIQPVDPDAPVCHISYFEADAYASWAGARLAREQEWERAAQSHPPRGNFLERYQWRPRAGPTSSADTVQQMYGDVWEWTQSPYTAYPGFKIAEGAIGEYNGKFMCGQFVLRGGSCVTPVKQIRPSYRNFFYPHQRWQFSGMRLAKDV